MRAGGQNVCFPGVRSERLIRGVRAGAIGAAAGAGALVGFGLRQGMPARPFNALAVLLVGDRARGIWEFDVTASTLGVVLLFATCIAIGTVVSLVLDRRAAPEEAFVMRRSRLAAFAVALIVLALALYLIVRHVPDVVGARPGSALAPGQAVVAIVLVSTAIASGMRLAR